MANSSENPSHPQSALVLSGGGARAAYQVGVLNALAEIAERNCKPFDILCGTSAGAINAAGLAAQGGHLQKGSESLTALWKKLESRCIFRTDFGGVSTHYLRLLLSFLSAGYANTRPIGLLDNTPLRKFLADNIDFEKISAAISTNELNALCISAMNYSLGQSANFFQGGPEHTSWQRWKRAGIPSPLRLEHLMASSAIPTLFPPERIGRDYFGDGALRQIAPLSPALHLGAERILVISANNPRNSKHLPTPAGHPPRVGQVIGHMLNSAFIDNLESDIELLNRVNKLIRYVPQEVQSDPGFTLKPVEFIVVSPSQSIDDIAEKHLRDLPFSLKSFLWVTGNARNEGGVNIGSYLLFEQAYFKELIELGYNDAKKQQNELAGFLSGCH